MSEDDNGNADVKPIIFGGFNMTSYSLNGPLKKQSFRSAL